MVMVNRDVLMLMYGGGSGVSSATKPSPRYPTTRYPTYGVVRLPPMKSCAMTCMHDEKKGK